MTKLEELEQTIATLPESEYNALRIWFLERDWEAWDREFEADEAAGRLDFLIAEAEEAKASQRLRPL